LRRIWSGGSRSPWPMWWAYGLKESIEDVVRLVAALLERGRLRVLGANALIGTGILVSWRARRWTRLTR
jgi:hypothetical protein